MIIEYSYLYITFLRPLQTSHLKSPQRHSSRPLQHIRIYSSVEQSIHVLNIAFETDLCRKQRFKSLSVLHLRCIPLECLSKKQQLYDLDYEQSLQTSCKGRLKKMWIFIALFTTAVLLFVLNRKQRYTYFERLGIPGPRPSFFLGNLGQMRTLGAFESEKYWKKKFGKVYGIFFGPSPTLIVSDEEMLREILVKQCENFYDRPSSK